MHELTKSDKKILRIAIEKGVQLAYVAALEELDVLTTKWKNKQLDNTTAYKSIFKITEKHDSMIGRRYDGLTGSRYLQLVCVLYAEETITDEDLEGLSDEVMVKIRWFKQFSENN